MDSVPLQMAGQQLLRVFSPVSQKAQLANLMITIIKSPNFKPKGSTSAHQPQLLLFFLSSSSLVLHCQLRSLDLVSLQASSQSPPV